MTPEFMTEYAAFVAGLTPEKYDVPASKAGGDVFHAVLGIASEAGEVVDAAKKTFAYGKLLDFTNLDEEMGDLLWYIQLYANVRGVSIEHFIIMNARKLSVRYPEKAFRADRALSRDLDAERNALEDN